MSAKGRAQGGYLASNFGEKWTQERHYNNAGPLSPRAGKPKTIEIPKIPKIVKVVRPKVPRNKV